MDKQISLHCIHEKSGGKMIPLLGFKNQVRSFFQHNNFIYFLIMDKQISLHCIHEKLGGKIIPLVGFKNQVRSFFQHNNFNFTIIF